ncbi:cell division protein DivIVA [Streptomyces sp. NPDC047108]|uniref:cell division protein DivIVA n=1 Tax=Streptomyces sp. NPDC047108 TaxID=3155025 RepID=UPI0033CB8959
MFWFLLIALVAVVAAVTLVVVGGDDGVALSDADPDRLDDRLPADRPVARADLESLRLPTTVRGYSMTSVDDVLGRLGAELAERDARIAELEAALAGAQASAIGGNSLLKDHDGGDEFGGYGSAGGYGARGGHEEYGQDEPRGFDGRGRSGGEHRGDEGNHA